MVRSARLAVLAALLPAGALAQTPDEPVDRSRLPSLTPRVFESRGTLAVSLPDLERQPLGGFGPAPRTYVVPETRAPIERPFAADLDALPAVALPPPAEPEPDDRLLRRVRAEAGAGANWGRYGRANLSGVGASGEFFVDGRYDGVGENGQYVGSDGGAVRAGARSYAPGNLSIEGFGRYDEYGRPFEARYARRGYGAAAGVEGLGAVPYRARLGFEQGRYTETNGAVTTEGRVDGSAEVGLLGDRVRLDASGGVAGAGGFSNDLRYGSAGGAVFLGRDDGARLALGARVLSYVADAVAGDGDALAVGPIVDLSLPVGPTTRVFATNDPHLVARSLLALTDENPFVAANAIVVPDVARFDARVGVELRPGLSIVRAYGLLVETPTRLVFETVGGAFAERYVSATHVGLGGDVTAASTSGVSASAGLEVRYGQAGTDGEIPYFAPLVGRAGLQVPFDGGRGRVGFGAEGQSARPVDLGGSSDADPFGRLTLDARYDVVAPFSAVLRGERLVGSAERWPGFPEPPFTLMLGVRLSR